MNTPTQPPAPPPAPEAPVRDAPAFDFYPERWLVGVASMSDAEQIAYLRLLCHQWLQGDNGLPPDAASLRRLGGKGVTTAVMDKVPLMADGRRRNLRLEIIREEQRERIAKSRDRIGRMNAARAAGRATKPAAASPAPAPHGTAAAAPEALPHRLQDRSHEHLQEALQEALQEDRAESPGEALGEDLQEPLAEPHEEARVELLDGFLTTHHSPPTTEVPEDANNAGAGAREAGAAGAAVSAISAAAMRSAACQQAAAGAATSRQAQGAQGPGPSRGRDPHDCPRDDDGAVRHTPDLPTVLAWATAIGCPPDKAEIWFLEHDARPLTPHGRWTDRDGNAVQRPHSALAAWWQKWRANDHQRSTRQHAPSSTGYHATARPASPRTDTANLPGRYA